MGRIFFVPVWILGVVAALTVQQEPHDTAQAVRYRALVREFQDAQQVYTKGYAAAGTDLQRREAQASRPDPAAFAGRFLDLARQKPGDPASFDALSWTLTHGPNGSADDQALELIAAGHLDEPRLGPILLRLGSSPSPAAERLLRSALEKSPDREVQAHACYTLAQMLTARTHRATPAKHRTGKPKKTETPDETEKSAQLYEEIELLYGRLLKDFRDIKSSRKKTYGEIALAALDKFKVASGRRGNGNTGLESSQGLSTGLEIGMIAPEIQGLDTRGNPMRLSNLRGRVVVVDFWGDW
jgi:hypothetical protein